MEILLLITFVLLVLFIDSRYTKWVVEDLGVSEDKLTWRIKIVIFMAALGTPTVIVGILVWVLKVLMWIVGVPA